MKHAMATTVSRRGLLSRLLMAAAVAPVMGTMVVPEVDAKKIQAHQEASSERSGGLRNSRRDGDGRKATRRHDRDLQ